MRGTVSARIWWGAVAIVLVAAALRFAGLRGELPFIHHPDEPTNINVVHGMLRDGSANPGAFNYPSLFYYLHVPGQWIVRQLRGELQPLILQAPASGVAPQPAVFMVGRALTALFGVGVVIATMALACEIAASAPLILFAGLLAACNPLLLAHSRVIAPDVPSAFFCALALIGAARVMKREGAAGYLPGGIMTGFAASVKYNAGLVGLSIAAGHLARHGFSGARLHWLALSGLLAIATFLLTSPFMLLDFADASRGILAEVHHYATGHPGFEGEAWKFNAIWLWQAFSVSLALVLLAPLHPARARLVPVAAFAVLYFALISVQVVRFDRNLMPIIPARFVLAACGFDVLRLAMLRRFAQPRIQIASVVGLACIALLPSAVRSVSDTLARFSDKRAGVRDWIVQHVRPGTSIMIDAYGPYLDPAAYALMTPGFVLRQPRETLSSVGAVIVAREGSGRFLRDARSPETATLEALGKSACERKEFHDRAGEPDFLVFRMRC